MGKNQRQRFEHRVETRREEAQARQAAYDKIPLEQRLKTAGKKEAAKIQAKLNKK